VWECFFYVCRHQLFSQAQIDMETRADVQHRITLIKDEFSGIMRAMENLFDKIYALNELPIGSWKESEEKRLPLKKPRAKKIAVVVASPTGPVADEIINV